MTNGIHESLRTLAVPLDRLRTMPGNPNRGDVDAVARSLAAFGQRKPIVATRDDDESGTVSAGNHTLLAARSLGWDSVAVVWTNDDDITARAWALADNRTAELSETDDASLAAWLADIVEHADSELIEATSYDQAFIDDLLGRYDAGLVLEDLDDEDESDDLLDVDDVYSVDEIVDLAFAHWRTQQFPYPEMTKHEALALVNRLARTKTSALRTSSTAHNVADMFHRRRFSTKVLGKVTPLQAFDDDAKLRHALELLAQEGHTITPTSLRTVLGYVRGAQCAANFRPAFALLMLRKYAPHGGAWLDTSAGYGGRLVGFAASHLFTYVGIDPEQNTQRSNTELAKMLGIDDRVELIVKPAEDVTLDDVGGQRFDVAFTSPPYFAKERYSDDASQSWVRYGTLDDWLDGFLTPTLELQRDALKPNARAIVNIADVIIKGQTYPLVEETIARARLLGFDVETIDALPMSRVPGRGERTERSEPVIVFVKR